MINYKGDTTSIDMGKDNRQSKDRPIWQRIKRSVF